MDSASACFLGVGILFLLTFAAIVLRSCSVKEKLKGEQAKYRMLEDD